MNCLYLAGGLEFLLTGTDETYANDVLLERYAAAPSSTDVDYFMARGNKIAAMYAAAHSEGLEGSPYALWVRALERPEEDHSEAWEQYRDWVLSAGVDLISPARQLPRQRRIQKDDEEIRLLRSLESTRISTRLPDCWERRLRVRLIKIHRPEASSVISTGAATKAAWRPSLKG